MKFTGRISGTSRPRVRPFKFQPCPKERTSRSKSSPSLVTARAPSPTHPANIDICMSEDLLALFRKTGALLDGHFVLRSGLHRRRYFQCAFLLQHTELGA